MKLGGLDVYSGYWLAVDSPGHSIEDPLQEEGVDTLRRVMEAAQIQLNGAVCTETKLWPALTGFAKYSFAPKAS